MAASTSVELSALTSELKTMFEPLHEAVNGEVSKTGDNKNVEHCLEYEENLLKMPVFVFSALEVEIRRKLIDSICPPSGKYCHQIIQEHLQQIEAPCTEEDFNNSEILESPKSITKEQIHYKKIFNEIFPSQQ